MQVISVGTPDIFQTNFPLPPPNSVAFQYRLKQDSSMEGKRYVNFYSGEECVGAA